MNNPFADTLHLRVRPSAAYRGFVAVLHLLAIGVVLPLAWFRPPLLVLLPIIIGLGVWADRRAALRAANAIQRLRWQADDCWRWQTVDGAWHEGRRVGSFCLGDTLVVLSLRERSQRFVASHCVLFADALGATGHRHLRARLTIAPDPRAVSDEAI